MIKKIISFSLWGNNPKYTMGAISNVKIANRLFLGWTCRFYTAYDVSSYIVSQLQDLGAECVIMSKDDSSGWNGMFWRFLAADSDDTIISRDTDSRLGYREKAAVEEWLASDKNFHIMRDHPFHATEILGGMWGARNGLLKGITEVIKDYNKRDFDNRYQVDQNFLREIVYPKVKDKAIVHDEFFDKKPFPISAPKRTNINFVGQVYNEYEVAQFLQ